MNTQLNSGPNGAKDKIDAQGTIVHSEHLLKDMLNAMPTIDNTQARFEKARAVVGQTAQRAADVSASYVKENPWKTMGVVAVVGLVAGLLLNRRGE